MTLCEESGVVGFSGTSWLFDEGVNPKPEAAVFGQRLAAGDGGGTLYAAVAMRNVTLVPVVPVIGKCQLKEQGFPPCWIPVAPPNTVGSVTAKPTRNTFAAFNGTLS